MRFKKSLIGSLLVVLFFGLFPKISEAATFNFNKLYKGTGTSYGLNTQSIIGISPISGTSIQFYQEGAQFSGNSINGILTYYDNNNQKQTIYGNLNRQDKSGSVSQSFYFIVSNSTFTTFTGEAYLFIVPGKESVYATGANVSTSSDPMAAALNAVVNAMPTITVSGSFSGYSTCVATPSATQTLTVSASNLSANLSISAPSGFEISWSPSSGFTNNLSVSPVSNAVSSRTLYVRLTGVTVGSYSGNVLFSSTNAGSIIIPASGSTNAIPNVTISPASLSISSGASATLTASGASTYSWSPSTGLSSSTGSVVISTPTTTTTYTVTGTISGCTNTKNITVTVKTGIIGGQIAQSQTICYGNTPDLLTSTAEASNNTGTITYSWEYSTDNVNFSPITSTNTSTYSPGALTINTYYRRKATDNTDFDYSNVILITINPLTVGGSISGSTNVCSGSNSTILTLSGQTGDITKWQSALTSDFTGTVTDIANTTTSLTATDLATTTYYRALVQSGSCTAANSGTASITVVPSSVGGTIAGSASVCSGSNSTVLTLSGQTGSITKWQSAATANFSGTVTDIANTTTSLTATNITATTYYRAVVQSGSCTAANSGTASITVVPSSVGGTIAGSASVCSGSNSTVLTLSGQTGSITKWQSATAADFSGTVTDIANTTTSLTSTNITTSTYYRAVVQSGSCTAANSGTASITVTNCIEVNPDNNSTSVSVPVSGNVSTNDIITAGTTYGTPTASTTNPTGATITIDAATGTYTFTATTPGKYVFFVSVCSAGQTSSCPVTLLQITVLDPTVPNNPPVANSDIATTNLNTAVTTSILANDKSGNIGTVLVPSSVTIVTQPKNGTVVVNADGTLTYTPTTGFSGKDSLVYNVCDNGTPANCQSTSVYYTVLAAGAVSTTSALDDYAYVTNNKTGTASVSGTVLSNDKNTAGAALTASLVTGPTADQGTLTLNADGTYTFVPTLGFKGPIDVVYNACTSDNPAICAKATLHIVVSPPPTINPDFNSTNVNTPVPGSINTNDIIPAGTTYGTPLPSNNNPTGGTITVNAATGTYTFTATKPGKYIFQVPVCAASQTTGCPLSPLQITVLDPNKTDNPPVANNDYSSTKLNTPVTTLILANDKPGNINTSLIPTSIVVNTAPKNGTGRANITTTTSTSAIKSLATVGTITYTPNNGFTGLDSLVYTVCDNATPSNCEVATVYYTISTATPNSVLVANDDYNTSTNRVPALGNLLLNDDYGGATLTSTLVTGPTSAQGVAELSSDGTYKFTPAAGFTGPVDIIYQACSGTTCINATLHILVNLVPPPPPTVVKATYVAGSRSNPSDIKSLVTVTPAGTTLKWCDPTGTTCTTTPPTLPTTPGTYIWCVKSVDIVTLLSSTCAMDTVVILAPYTVMEVTKTARSIKLNPDGSVLLTFVLKAANKTNAQMDSVSIKDDLSQTFKTTTGFSIAGVDVYGGLVKNTSYDGVLSIDLVTNTSKIAANSIDSVILKVLIASPSINGSLTNTAIMGGKTKYGYVTVNSNDPIANPSDTTRRTPTPFVVPKEDLIIAGGFSPNNDGLNDRWIIVRPFGTTIKVKVFNRWGNIVYENENYKNDWDGRGQKNFMGEYIPEGTYFYVVNAVDASGNVKNFASSMTVVR
jgi:gliding motility-associated-like protein